MTAAAPCSPVTCSAARSRCSLPLLMHAGHLPLWALLFMSVLISLLGSFHGASFDTSYSLLVPKANSSRAPTA